MSQGALFSVTSHSNLGKGFERELRATHDWYRMNGTADVIQNPNEWAFISEKEYASCMEKLRKGQFPPGSLAECDNGRKMQRVKSDVDFAGGGKGFSVCFDAKETEQQSRFPLSNLKASQIERVVRSSRCGVAIAGFMVKFTVLDRVFFIPAAMARAKENKLLAQTGGGRKRARPGTASFSIEELESGGAAIEIFRHKNGLWDWMKYLL